MTTAEVLYEHRPHPKRSGPVNLVTKDKAYKLGGFISTHGFTRSVVELIESRKGTYGLDKVPLYLDTVVVDFDDADEAYRAALKVCQSKGWSFKAYHTGNRGYHIHVDIVPLCEIGVYQKAALWVAQQFAGYDPSMYKPTGMTRIPGTYHAKTGKPMVLVAEGSGLRPDIRQIKIPMPVVAPITDASQHEYDLEGDFAVMLRRPVAKGGRNQHIYRLFARGLEIGLAEEELMELVEGWNTSYCIPPTTTQELQRTLKSAQRRREAV